MDSNMPPHSLYWLEAESKHDCYFVVGPEEGPTERIGAFKIFLVGYSEPLRKMLDESELKEKGDVRLTDIEPDSFKDFLKCVYGAADFIIPELSFERLAKLLYILDKYLILCIKDQVVLQMLQNQFTMTNIFTALLHPVCLEQHLLERALLEILAHSADELFAKEKFLRVSPDALLWILKQESLCTKEVNIWEAVYRWAKHNNSDKESMRALLSKHLKLIRFCSMTCEEFCQHVVPKQILTAEEVYDICNSLGRKVPPKLDHICDNFKSRSVDVDPVDPLEMEETSFYHIVNNIKEYDGNHNSSQFTFHRHNWSVYVRKDNNNFGVFLKCHGSVTSSSHFRVSVEADLVLVNQGTRGDLRRSVRHTFDKNEDDWGFSVFVNFDEMLDRKRGFVKNNYIVLMARLQSAKSPLPN